MQKLNLYCNFYKKILGKEDASQIDISVLELFDLMMKPEVVLDISSFWQENINSQFMSLTLIDSFKFPSVVTYLFMYQNAEEFLNFGLNIMDSIRKRHE